MRPGDSAEFDLVVEFSLRLLEKRENLFARRVDLVEIGAVRNPYLRREIEEHQETLSAALSSPLTQNW